MKIVALILIALVVVAAIRAFKDSSVPNEIDDDRRALDDEIVTVVLPTIEKDK